jgi:hypothetical protein
MISRIARGLIPIALPQTSGPYCRVTMNGSCGAVSSVRVAST